MAPIWITKWCRKCAQISKYLCNSFGTSVLHHARPSSHQCDAEQHPHKNPRKQTHFPRFQTPPSPFQHKNTNPKVKPKTNTPTWEKSTNSSKKKNETFSEIREKQLKGSYFRGWTPIGTRFCGETKSCSQEKNPKRWFFFLLLVNARMCGTPFSTLSEFSKLWIMQTFSFLTLLSVLWVHPLSLHRIKNIALKPF